MIGHAQTFRSVTHLPERMCNLCIGTFTNPRNTRDRPAQHPRNTRDRPAQDPRQPRAKGERPSDGGCLLRRARFVHLLRRYFL